MILSVSDDKFLSLVDKSAIRLPRRWSGNNFSDTLKGLFNQYKKLCDPFFDEDEKMNIHEICGGILESVDQYFSGHLDLSYNEFRKVMKTLLEYPLREYQKTDWTGGKFRDLLNLYRVRCFENNTELRRSDIFHTPFSLRSKVPSCRYSIAGFPSLYLGTCLRLCVDETPHSNDRMIASRFVINRDYRTNGGKSIKVIELAIKPQDFSKYKKEDDNSSTARRDARNFDEIDLNDSKVRKCYLYWYPLIAACSFIRTNKSDPFAAEYVVPQMLMQWLRSQYSRGELYGIRYFSCASLRASEMGFNYVFPTSGKKYGHRVDYCADLVKTFKLCVPCHLIDFSSVEECEKYLLNNRITDFITGK